MEKDCINCEIKDMDNGIRIRQKYGHALRTILFLQEYIVELQKQTLHTQTPVHIPDPNIDKTDG